MKKREYAEAVERCIPQTPPVFHQAMSRALEAAPAADAGIDAARYYRDQVASRLEEMRSIIDRMEPLVGADYWPYPTYADILFSV